MTSGGYILLEDGTLFEGESCGAPLAATGEVVFTTGMSGYQESVTDPSFAGQLLIFTYPHIGNYGVSQAAMESGKIHATGVIMRAAGNSKDAAGAESGWLDWLRKGGIPALTDVDTRALVRHVRSQGALRGGIFLDSTDRAAAMERVKAEPSMAGQDLARSVTTGEYLRFEARGAMKFRVVALDTGIKNSIIEALTSRGIEVELFPCTTPAETLLERNPDGFFLVPGPGDPAALDYIVETVRALIGRKPIFGICLGHQLLARALGLTTFKLPFGHRGANHPVKDLRTGHIAITSQNHGFCVSPPPEGTAQWSTQVGAAEVTHMNLYDNTVAGLRLVDFPVASVQYHPEACPGPHDAAGLFDEFLELMERPSYAAA